MMICSRRGCAALMVLQLLAALPAVALAQAGSALPAGPAAAASAPATSFVLREIKLPPTQAVPGRDLELLVQPYLGRAITDADLRALVQGVKQLYEDRGFGLAAIGLPTQDVTRGTLTLAIVEPRIQRVSFSGGEAAPLPQQRLQRILGHYGVADGRDLNINALDRAMFALNDLPGVAAKATLGASGDEGSYDLVVETAPRRAWDAQVELDNHGSSSSGKLRLGGVARWNNPLHIGDNLDLRLLLSSGGGVAVGRLGYELPVAYTPARAGLGYSRVEYELGDEFAALGANGTADVLDASIAYPLLRSRGRNLVVRAGAEHKRLEDRFDTVDVVPIVTPKRVNALSLALNYEGRDGWGGGGFSGAALQWRQGRLRFDDPAQAQNDADEGEGATAGSFSKLELQLSRLQGLTRELQLHAGLTAQFARKNLDGSEKVTLGGPKAVRSYPKAEAASDEAVILSTELRWWLNPRWTVFALADAARGRLQKRPAPPTAQVPEVPVNVRKLQAAGLGLYFSDPQWFTATATLAVRGSEAPQSEPGEDRRQFFVQVSRSF